MIAYALPVLGFENPSRLWVIAIVPLFVVLYLFLLRRKGKTGMRFTNTGVLERVLPKQSQWLRHLTVALSLISLITLVGAWARPLGVEKVPRERATIVIVLDVSQSMQATDVTPTRLDAEKAAAVEFVRSLPALYNLSLVSLSGSPAVRVPPITDRTLMERAIQRLELQDSTAIGDAIYAGLAALQQAPRGADGSVAPGAIVLLSDGQNTAGQAPLQAAFDSKKAGVPVYTIAFGTELGYVDLDGKRELVPPDPALLRQIAVESGGQTYTADDLSGLKDVYKNIKSDVGYEEAHKEITATAAGVGLVLALLAAVGAVMLGARWP